MQPEIKHCVAGVRCQSTVVKCAIFHFRNCLTLHDPPMIGPDMRCVILLYPFATSPSGG